jgi:CTP:molybdopterin cytidylyltransferase MocA
MGRPKALLPVSAEPGAPTFVDALVAAFAAAGCAPIVVVQGAYAFEPPPGSRCVAASDWALGMRASLRAGLRGLDAQALAGGVLMTHVDRPRVAPETLARLLAGGPGTSRVPYHRGEPGHPVFLSAALCAALARPPDADLAPLSERLLGDAARVEVDDPDVLLNVNTPAELAALHVRAIGSGR